MPGPNAAVFAGTCSGHGIELGCGGPPHGNVQCIPAGGSCATAPKKTVAAMNAYTLWPPAPLIPKAAPLCATIKVNKIVPIVAGDVLQEHKSPTMNLVISTPCPKAQEAPVNLCCNATLFTCAEDAGGVGHPRIAVATSKTVFFEKKPACRVGDPFAAPCLSKITTGAANVFIGG